MNAHTETLSPTGAAAMEYAARGWHVLPIMAGHKGGPAPGLSNTHHLPNGHNGASCDPELVRRWWTLWPDANIGLHLAASGLVALDPDLYKPDCAWQNYIQGRDLPDTLVQRSARGGMHYIFRAPPGDEFIGDLCRGVEIKHKGYILLEPSTFEGKAYRFETDNEPAPCPDWVPRKDVPERPKPQGAPKIDTGFDDAPADLAEVTELLAFIDPDGGGYDAWVSVLMALHDHTGGSANGLSLATNWSAQGSLYRQGEVEAKWRGFKPGGGVRMNTIAHMARQAGADLSEIARRHRLRRDFGPAPGRNDQPPPPQDDDDELDLSHDALALDLGRRSWDHNARHVATWDRWLFWNDTHWIKDDRLEHLTRAREYLRRRAAEITAWADRKAATLPEKDADKLRQWAADQSKTLRSATTIAAVEKLARANKDSVAGADDFDADLMLLGTPGGVVDLKTGILRKAHRADLITKQTATAPAPEGTVAPTWLRFLDDVFQGDQQTIAFMQRVAGYALTGLTTEHKLLFLYGTGRNGKSTYLDMLQWLWGDYSRRAAAQTFLYSQTQQHPTDIAGLQGARLVVGSELPKGKVWDEAVIKDLTGGDKMTARFMRGDFFDFDPQLTLMIAGNNMPSFRGVDEAIRARVVLVPFTVTIPPEKRDKALPEKLKAEGPAILRWAIEGAKAWQAHGLQVPASIMAASQEYFDDEDMLGQFLQDETLAVLGAYLSAAQIHQRFVQWCHAQGLQDWTQRTLVKELKSRGFQEAKVQGNRGFRGLKLQ